MESVTNWGQTPRGLTPVAFKPDQLLDCYGLLCPVPVRKTATALEGLRVGEILEVIATDDWFVPDLEAWLAHHPHELLGVQAQGSETHVFLRKQSLS